MNDYYAILGVPRDASAEQIKKAYRKLARELHPDVAGPEAEDKFKDVSRAYEVLSNAEKRQMYDLGQDPSQPGGGRQGAGGFDFQDIFETFFGGGTSANRGPIPRTRRGQDALLSLEIELRDAVFGVAKEITFDTAVVCATCDGSCVRPGTSPQTCDICHGAGNVRRVARSLFGEVVTAAPCGACQGYGTKITDPCPECSGEGRVRTRTTLEVDVPAGVQDGNRIRLTGKGEVGPGGGPAGDLYLEIRQRSHKTFTRRGDDLHCTLHTPMTAATLGAQITLDTFDGEQAVNIPPGTQPGHTVVLKGLGVGRLHRNSRGDLRVKIAVEIPQEISDEERDLLAQLAKLRGEEHPEPDLAAAGSGMFTKLRDKLSGR